MATRAIYHLPVGGDPDQTVTLNLDGISYDLRIKYNQRLIDSGTKNPVSLDSWNLFIGLAGQEPFRSTPLKTSRNLLESFRYLPECPKGFLILYDTLAVNAVVDPSYKYSPERVTFEGLGERWQLVYLTVEE